ncbi:hypothetical protein [Stutzerimonas stutzeri]|uniref:hypothetical protein n=1 Tax=Stutzerimonas stutzeri TaxID=316 RepID=UPI0002EFFC47|nr:hypothetical protein [Stutzerimonas stutzeri]
MTAIFYERRENHRLRRHIDCLLNAGASLTGRSPISIEFHECAITVRNGMLFSENGLRSLVAAIAMHVWPCHESRQVAVEICLGQLDICQEDSGISCKAKSGSSVPGAGKH